LFKNPTIDFKNQEISAERERGGDRVIKLLYDPVFRVIKKLKLNSRSFYTII
jgi:hypothetical protein